MPKQTRAILSTEEIARTEAALNRPAPSHEPTETCAITIRPYSPGLLLMTLPVGLILPEAHAISLLGQIHDGLDQLRKLMSDHQSPEQDQKNGQHVRQGVGARKRKR